MTFILGLRSQIKGELYWIFNESKCTANSDGVHRTAATFKTVFMLSCILSVNIYWTLSRRSLDRSNFFNITLSCLVVIQHFLVYEYGHKHFRSL